MVPSGTGRHLQIYFAVWTIFWWKVIHKQYAARSYILIHIQRHPCQQLSSDSHQSGQKLKGGDSWAHVLQLGKEGKASFFLWCSLPGIFKHLLINLGLNFQGSPSVSKQQISRKSCEKPGGNTQPDPACLLRSQSHCIQLGFSGQDGSPNECSGRAC